MADISPVLGSIDKYIGAAEAAVRKGLGTAPKSSAPVNTAEASNTLGQATALNDTVSLADRADSLLLMYGADARFKGTVQGIKDNTSAKVLNAIGATASYTQAAPTTTNQTRTLENGTQRSTETTILSRTVQGTAAKNNNGIGVQRSFSETVIRESSGYQKSGTAIADTVRRETTEAVSTADAAKGTLTQSFTISAVITNSADSNTTYEQRNRVIVYSTNKDGNVQKSLREVLTSVVKNAAGEVIGTTQSEASETSVVDKATGTLKVSRVDDVVAASNSNGQTVVSTRRVSTNITTTDTSGGTNPTVGNVTITEKALSSNVVSRNDGTVDTASTTDRSSTFKGVGTTVTSGSTTLYSQASWLKSDGTLGGGATERTTSFVVKADTANPAQQVLNRSNSTNTTSNIGLRANGTIDVQAYSVGVSTSTNSKGKLSAPNFSVKGATITEQIAAGTQNAQSARQTGPNYLLANGVLTLQAVSDRTNGPTVTLDVANRRIQAVGRPTTAGATVDGIAGMLQVYNNKGSTRPLLVTRDKNDVLTAVEKNPTSQKSAQLAVQVYNGNYALGTATKGVRGFTPVTNLVKTA
ncbi:hypothetical protein [Elstera cyanobacteriorum]|nr:hypothetical protein [Elstera cyanobacteriorum]